MKKSKRFCDNPSPAGGGAECKGKEIKETSCLAIDKDGKDIPCPRKYLARKPKRISKRGSELKLRGDCYKLLNVAIETVVVKSSWQRL